MILRSRVWPIFPIVMGSQMIDKAPDSSNSIRPLKPNTLTRRGISTRPSDSSVQCSNSSKRRTSAPASTLTSDPSSPDRVVMGPICRSRNSMRSMLPEMNRA